MFYPFIAVCSFEEAFTFSTLYILVSKAKALILRHCDTGWQWEHKDSSTGSSGARFVKCGVVYWLQIQEMCGHLVTSVAVVFKINKCRENMWEFSNSSKAVTVIMLSSEPVVSVLIWQGWGLATGTCAALVTRGLALIVNEPWIHKSCRTIVINEAILTGTGAFPYRHPYNQA